jgi:hypothetical protein
MAEKVTMTSEDMCRAGFCSDCGGPMKPWTREEIIEAKNDLGMGDYDEFSCCCKECEVLYTEPCSDLARYRWNAILELIELKQSPDADVRKMSLQFAYARITGKSLFEVVED